MVEDSVRRSRPDVPRRFPCKHNRIHLPMLCRVKARLLDAAGDGDLAVTVDELAAAVSKFTPVLGVLAGLLLGAGLNL